jgi:polyisoprenoid-binding protein YceI
MSIQRILVTAFWAFSVGGLASAARADNYKVDPVHSFSVFSIHHFNAGNVWGRFNDPAGQFSLDNADPAKDAFTVEIKVANLDTANPKRDSDLKGPDWFNARQFPTITFKSASVAKADGNNLNVTGNLTIHGVTKSVTVPVEVTGIAPDPFGKVRAGIQAIVTIKRSDFGMKGMPAGVGDDVRLIVALEGVKQ